MRTSWYRLSVQSSSTFTGASSVSSPQLGIWAFSPERLLQNDPSIENLHSVGAPPLAISSSDHEASVAHDLVKDGVCHEAGQGRAGTLGGQGIGDRSGAAAVAVAVAVAVVVERESCIPGAHDHQVATREQADGISSLRARRKCPGGLLNT